MIRYYPGGLFIPYEGANRTVNLNQQSLVNAFQIYSLEAIFNNFFTWGVTVTGDVTTFNCTGNEIIILVNKPTENVVLPEIDNGDTMVIIKNLNSDTNTTVSTYNDSTIIDLNSTFVIGYMETVAFQYTNALSQWVILNQYHP